MTGFIGVWVGSRDWVGGERARVSAGVARPVGLEKALLDAMSAWGSLAGPHAPPRLGSHDGHGGWDGNVARRARRCFPLVATGTDQRGVEPLSDCRYMASVYRMVACARPRLWHLHGGPGRSRRPYHTPCRPSIMAVKAAAVHACSNRSIRPTGTHHIITRPPSIMHMQDLIQRCSEVHSAARNLTK